MLKFQRDILEEIVKEDGLLILSSGLGLFQLFGSLVQLYVGGKHLVLIINSTQEEDQLLHEQLKWNGVSAKNNMNRIVYNTLAETRSNMYRQGGIFSVTSRILAVDLLLKRIPTAIISGIIVYNAHRIKPHSMEELILRIYRDENDHGFIKAFSDRPESFVTGFAPLQNKLKALQLRKVHLWPRFHVTVAEDLSQTDNNVIELYQPMTEAMEIIQQSLVQCMDMTLKELKRSNSSIDVEELTIENAFFRSFDQIVRIQLDPIWHQVSPASKQLVGDLKILRQLIRYLTAYDCVSFYSFMETVIAANTSQEGKQVRQSQWLFLEAGDRAVSTARKRVYLRKDDSEFDDLEVEVVEQDNTDMPSHIKLVLEEQPKWKLLRTILEEIQTDTIEESAPILIMVSDTRTCSQIKQYIANTDSLFLKQIARSFFKWRSNIQSVQTNYNNQQQKPQQQQQQQQQQQPQQQSQQQQQQAPTPQGGRGPPNKRRRVRGGSAAASNPGRSSLADTFKNDVIETTKILDDDIEQEEDQDEGFIGIGPISDDIEIQLGDHDILPRFEQVDSRSTVTIQCYEQDVNNQILEDLQPQFIIMYDPNPAFIRQIEVYRALNPTLNVRVYFAIYENSVEEQNYLSLIRKEKQSFEKLIHEKSIMAIPMTDKRKPANQLDVIQVNTRHYGGQIKVAEKSKVIVDMREFRSSLPPMLYGQGIDIIPCTLQVGDYILSPDMCVERKSISDLIQSFASGRLYTQCESMSLFYKIPILLIEFEENKSFSLQSLSSMNQNVRESDLSSKLVLLTLSFPKLRIIWSSNPNETATVFEELKKSEEQPDLQKAGIIGAEEGENGETIHNMTPQDMLRSMPGITSANYRHVMNNVNNLNELVHMSKKQMTDLIGTELGNKLYRFINKKP